MEDDDKKLPDHPLSKALGLQPMDNGLKLKPNGKFIVPDPNDDYEHARQNMIDMIEQMTILFGQFAQVSTQANEPRHFEVLNGMFQSIIDANEKLVDLKKKDQDLKTQAAKNNQDQPTINNNLVVNSTDELLTMLEAMEERKSKKKLKKDAD